MTTHPSMQRPPLAPETAIMIEAMADEVAEFVKEWLTPDDLDRSIDAYWQAFGRLDQFMFRAAELHRTRSMKRT